MTSKCLIAMSVVTAAMISMTTNAAHAEPDGWECVMAVEAEQGQYDFTLTSWASHDDPDSNCNVLGTDYQKWYTPCVNMIDREITVVVEYKVFSPVAPDSCLSLELYDGDCSSAELVDSDCNGIAYCLSTNCHGTWKEYLVVHTVTACISSNYALARVTGVNCGYDQKITLSWTDECP